MKQTPTDWAAVEEFVRRELYDIDSRVHPHNHGQLIRLRHEATVFTRDLRRLLGDPS